MDHNFKAPTTHWGFECHDKDGNLMWTEEFDNLVTESGINYLLSVAFKGFNYTASWFVGLLNTGAVLADTDTASAHAGWSEFVNYSQTLRPELILGAVAAKNVSNVAAKAAFTCNLAGTVDGCFLVNNATKSGTAGVIYSEALFQSGPKPVTDGAILTVTCNISGA